MATKVLRNNSLLPLRLAAVTRTTRTYLVPAVYPQVLALPISHRPLFPFYKAVVIRNLLVAAIREMIKHILVLSCSRRTPIAILSRTLTRSILFVPLRRLPVSFLQLDEKEDGLTTVLYPRPRMKY
jgi:hypothetical protein